MHKLLKIRQFADSERISAIPDDFWPSIQPLDPARKTCPKQARGKKVNHSAQNELTASSSLT